MKKPLIIILLLFPLTALAGEDHCVIPTQETINQYTTNTYQTYDPATPMAMSQASQRDWNTTRWQWNWGYANTHGQSAAAIGFAKKACRDCMVFGVTVGRQNDYTSISIGGGGRF